MKFGSEFIFLPIILAGATHLVLLSFSLSSYGGLIQSSTSQVFVFILFNIIISSILVRSYRPSAEYYSEFLPCGDFYHQAEEKQSEEMMHGDIEASSARSSNGDDCSYYFNSDGYEGEEEEDDDDDDDSDSNDEIGWGNYDKEYDETLETRIEAFIAKVISGWKEEFLADKLDCNQVD